MMRGTSVIKWWRGSVLILYFVVRLSCCIHSGLDGRYSSQLVGMGEVYVEMLWLIGILKVDLLFVDSIGKLSRGNVVLWSKVSGIIYILHRFIGDANYYLWLDVCRTYIYFVEGEYKNLCCWVDCMWFFVHYPSLLDDRNRVDCDCAQYIVLIVRDHNNHVDGFGLFWLGKSILLFAIFDLSPIKDPVISAVSFMLEISDKNITRR